MTPEPWVYVVLFAIVAILGIRGSWRLTARYHDVRDQLDERERGVLLSFVVVSWVITGAALYFGAVATWRILGYEPFAGMSVVSAIVATVVLLIPAFLDYVVDRVARVPWK